MAFEKKPWTVERLIKNITHLHHAKADTIAQATEDDAEEVGLPLGKRIEEFDRMIDLETEFKATLQEVQAWRERFPGFTYLSIDECIERVNP